MELGDGYVPVRLRGPPLLFFLAGDSGLIMCWKYTYVLPKVKNKSDLRENQ